MSDSLDGRKIRYISCYRDDLDTTGILRRKNYEFGRGMFIILEELLNEDSISLLEYESLHFDFPSSPSPPEKPPDDDVYFDIETRYVEFMNLQKWIAQILKITPKLRYICPS
ncbi:hypothetical protein Tco_0496699 [Tanacetum coccineum]